MAAEALELTDWEVTRTAADEHRGPGDLPDGLDWVPARVPGTVADAWRAAGRWSSDDVFDFDADDWWLRTRFETSRGPRQLRLGGVATIAEIWLNGALVLESSNMFHAHELDVELEAANEIVVVCRSLARHLGQRRPRPQWRTRLVESQNLRWVRTSFLGRMPAIPPRCAPVGLWRPVTVLDRAEASVTSLSPRLVRGVAHIDVAIVGPAQISAAWLQVGDRRYPLDLIADGSALRGSVELADVEPWFPASHGTPHLYECSVHAVVDGAEGVLCTRRLGFRSVAVDQTDGAFRLAVNGVTIFCRGAVWTPIDPVRLSSSRDLLHEALEQVQRSGANMLRVPGTGVYEQEELFELCDELGLLVWHDLAFANVDQPLDDDAYRASVVTEVEQFLVRCQSHPSVIVLCGGSEVEQQAAMMGVDASAALNRVGRELLPALAERLLPGVATVACSPFGGDLPFHVDHGIGHYFGVGAYRRPLVDARLCGARFVTESLAFASIPSAQTIDEWGIDPREPTGAEWKQRVPRDRGTGWDFDDVRDHYVEEIFGVRPLDVRYSDPERYLDLGRAAVAEAVRSTLSEFRRPSSACDGLLVLNQRDLVIGPGWGLVDAAGRAKSAYFGFKHAARPRGVSLYDEGLNGVRAAVFNDRDESLVGELTIRLFAVNGVILDQATAPVKVDAAKAIELSIDALFGRFLDLSFAYRFGPSQIDVVEATLVDESGDRPQRSHLLPAGQRRDRRVDLGLQAWFDVAGDAVVVRAEQFAQFVTIEVKDAEPDDDWFHLSPGEQRTIGLHTKSVPRAGTVRALNGYGLQSIQADGGQP